MRRCPLEHLLALTLPFDSIWAMLCEREGFSATSKAVYVMLLNRPEALNYIACLACMPRLGLMAF